MGLFAPGFFYLALHQITGFARETPVPEWKRSLHWYFGGVLTIVGLAAGMYLLFSEQGKDLCDQMDEQCGIKSSSSSSGGSSAGGVQGARQARIDGKPTEDWAGDSKEDPGNNSGNKGSASGDLEQGKKGRGDN